jgi:hypothetical protein
MQPMLAEELMLAEESAKSSIATPQKVEKNLTKLEPK